MKKTDSRDSSKKNDSKSSLDWRRVARVEKEVQSVISTFIVQKLQPELPGLVTISRVQVPSDLRQAKVFVSLLNLNLDEKVNEDDLDLALEILQAWAPEMQQAINQKIQMKYLPKLTFYADESTEKILKIENLLSNMKPAEKSSRTDDDDV
jgi:ribosome-binding factor A